MIMKILITMFTYEMFVLASAVGTEQQLQNTTEIFLQTHHVRCTLPHSPSPSHTIQKPTEDDVYILLSNESGA